MTQDEIVQNDKNAILSVKVEMRNDSTMGIIYEFRNISTSNIFVFNLLYGKINKNGEFIIDGDRCYVELSSQILEISKKVFPVPKGLNVYRPEIPCATLVKAGNTFTENIILPLPLIENNPYLIEKTFKDVTYFKFKFQLGYFIDNSKPHKPLDTIESTQGPVYYFYPFDIKEQHLLTVGPFKNEVEVH